MSNSVTSTITGFTIAGSAQVKSFNADSYKGFWAGFWNKVKAICHLGRRLILIIGEQQKTYFVDSAKIQQPLKRYGWFWFSDIVINFSDNVIDSAKFTCVPDDEEPSVKPVVDPSIHPGARKADDATAEADEEAAEHLKLRWNLTMDVEANWGGATRMQKPFSPKELVKRMQIHPKPSVQDFQKKDFSKSTSADEHFHQNALMNIKLIFIDGLIRCSTIEQFLKLPVLVPNIRQEWELPNINSEDIEQYKKNNTDPELRTLGAKVSELREWINKFSPTSQYDREKILFANQILDNLWRRIPEATKIELFGA